MKTLMLAIIAALALGCDKKSSEGTAPVASVAASTSAAPPAPPPPSSTAAAATPAPAASAPADLPTEEKYEQKAQTAIDSAPAAEAELKKLEKEIGP